MKRTTAAVNLFYLSQAKEQSDLGERLDWSVLEDRPAPRAAESIHNEICLDNQALRTSEDVKEKSFTIEVGEPLCEMRHDTQLVLVDIPGINEADSSLKYKRYVETKWSTFDCVVVVMDAVQGVNTQDQVDLLSFVHKNNKEKKGVPTVILGNKVDDPEHEAKLELVEEARQKAIEIFGPSCSEENLIEVEKAVALGMYDASKVAGAVFIPISAAYAFLYRKVGRMTSESLKTLDKEILDGIGEQEVVPKKWAKLSEQEKFEIVLGIVSNPTVYEESIERTNFHSFLDVLRFFIGGQTAQSDILADQIKYSLSTLSSQDIGSLSDSVREAYRKCQAIDRTTCDLVSHFWRVYDLAEDESKKKMGEEVDPTGLSSCFIELEKHFVLSSKLKWTDEKLKAGERLKKLVASQFSHVLQQKQKWSFVAFFNDAREKEEKLYCGGTYCLRHQGGCRTKCKNFVSGIYVDGRCGKILPFRWQTPVYRNWNNLSPQDWIILLSSVLLPSHEIEFYKDFGV